MSNWTHSLTVIVPELLMASGVVFPKISISPEGIAALTGSDITKVQVFMDAEPFSVFSLLSLTRRDVAEI